MNAVEQLAPSDLAQRLERLRDEATELLAAGRSANTKRANRSDWAHWVTWCEGYDLDHLPAAPTTVALYVTELARWARPATITRRLSSISIAHQSAGYQSPTHDVAVRATMSGVRRVLGAAQVGKSPLLISDIRAMVACMPDDVAGLRDRALLILGFAGGFRRSELVGLTMDCIVETSEGLVITVRRSKTDQEGMGRQIGLPRGCAPLTCPVTAYKAWITAGRLPDGPIFRAIDRHGNVGAAPLSGESVSTVVKRAAAAAGLDPSLFSAHSLRSGFATTAARAGVGEEAIMRITGHRSTATVRRYIRAGTVFENNASGRLGL